MTIQQGRLYRRSDIGDADWEAHEWQPVYTVGTPDDLWICVGSRPRALDPADIIDVEAGCPPRALPMPGPRP